MPVSFHKDIKSMRGEAFLYFVHCLCLMNRIASGFIIGIQGYLCVYIHICIFVFKTYMIGFNKYISTM